MKVRFKIWIWILFFTFITVLILITRENLRQDFLDLKDSLRISFQNIIYELFPERRRPISTYTQEQDLKMVVGEPFLNFKQSDWDRFWNLIYGVYPLDYTGERLPKKRRQYTLSEIEEKLKYYYSTPFFYFTREHWDIFWKAVFGKIWRER